MGIHALRLGRSSTFYMKSLNVFPTEEDKELFDRADSFINGEAKFKPFIEWFGRTFAIFLLGSWAIMLVILVFLLALEASSPSTNDAIKGWLPQSSTVSTFGILGVFLTISAIAAILPTAKAQEKFHAEKIKDWELMIDISRSKLGAEFFDGILARIVALKNLRIVADGDLGKKDEEELQSDLKKLYDFDELDKWYEKVHKLKEDIMKRTWGHRYAYLSRYR